MVHVYIIPTLGLQVCKYCLHSGEVNIIQIPRAGVAGIVQGLPVDLLQLGPIPSHKTRGEHLVPGFQLPVPNCQTLKPLIPKP